MKDRSQTVSLKTTDEYLKEKEVEATEDSCREGSSDNGIEIGRP